MIEHHVRFPRTRSSKECPLVRSRLEKLERAKAEKIEMQVGELRKNLPQKSQLRFGAGRFFRFLCSVTPFTRSDPFAIHIGKIRDSVLGREFLTEGELAHHLHVVGASGYGKSVFLTKLIEAQIKQGKGLLFVDLKGDLDFISRVQKIAKEADRENDLQIFNPAMMMESSFYNVLGRGSPTEIRDRVMASLTWSEEYYKHQAASYLLKVLIGLCYLRDEKGESFDLHDLLKLCTDIAEMRLFTNRVEEKERGVRPHVLDAQRFLGEAANAATLQGLRVQLESLVLSEFGELLRSKNEDSIEFFKAVNSGKLVFLFLDSRRYGATADVIGRFILQDLKSTSSKIDAEIPKLERKPFTIFIDEFADLAQEDFIGFLDRARSSKMSVVISHQELADLKRVSHEFAARVIANTSNTYAFLQKNNDSAEEISGLAGTRTVQKSTYQTEKLLGFEVRNGSGSVREVEEFVIHPNRIKSLKVGECVVVKKYPYARAHIVRVDAEE